VGEPEPAEVRTAALTRIFGIAAGFLGLLVLLDMIGPPESYSCSGEPPPEAAEARADYLPGAFALIAVFAVGFAWIAWRWTAERARRLGRPARPGAVPVVLAVLAAVGWTTLFVAAMTGERVGGPLLSGYLVAAAGLVALAVLLVLLLFHLAFVLPTSRNWAQRCEALTVAAVWVLLLAVFPAALVQAAVVGKDVTLFC
jgi:hypothetical protein